MLRKPQVFAPPTGSDTGGFLPLSGPERLITQTRHFAIGLFNFRKPTPVGCDRKSAHNPPITQVSRDRETAESFGHKWGG